MSKKTTSSASDGKGNYEIGRGKPPKASQFRKGQSGNPKGRRKGARNMKSIAREIMDEKILIRQDGKTKSASAIEILLRKARDEALRGGQKEFERLIKILERSFGDALDPPLPDTPTKVVWEFVDSDGNGKPLLTEDQWRRMEREKKASDEDYDWDR